MQNPTSESSSSENQNSRPALDMSNQTNLQCSRESDACAGKVTQGAVDHNTVFGEVDGMKEVPNPSNNIGRIPTDHINDDEIHDVAPITPSALETVQTDPTGMGSTEHISDAISTSSQESLSENSNLHDHVNEKLENFSIDDIHKADVSSGNIGEDAIDFINALHNAEEGIGLELDPSGKSFLQIS